MAFDWEHNLGHHKTYIGDQTLYAYFEDGFTVTFNSNGGRLKAEDPDVRGLWPMKADFQLYGRQKKPTASL